MKYIFFLFSILFATEHWKIDLLQKANEVRKFAYCPYSNYFVGAALLTKEGKVYLGVNVENAAYGSTICAERSALVSAISAGEKNFQAIAIVTKNGGYPCGACRQMLNEFAPNIRIITANEDLSHIEEEGLEELLPNAFGPKNLE